MKLVSHYFFIDWRSEISTMEYRLLNICIHWRDINHEYAIQEKIINVWISMWFITTTFIFYYFNLNEILEIYCITVCSHDVKHVIKNLFLREMAELLYQKFLTELYDIFLSKLIHEMRTKCD